MKKALFTAIVLFAATSAFAQTNFSGSWQIDTTRTVFGQDPKFVLNSALQVTQTLSGVITDRTNVANDGTVKHYQQQMTFDGKPSQTITINGNTETDSLGWSSDKSNLLVRMNTVSPQNQPVLSLLETWSLADDGKTLIIDRQVTQLANNFKYEIKGYYNKQ